MNTYTSSLKKVDDQYFSRVWQVVREIGETERHFNSLESQYRLLSSTWLLSSFVGMGFVLKTEAAFPVDKWWLIMAICLVSSLGIFMLWRIDLLVYHKLLHSAFSVGTEMENEFRFLPGIRSKMLESQGGTDVTKTIVLFYSVCINLLLAIGLFALLYIKFVDWGILFTTISGGLGILALVGLNFYMIKRSRKNLDTESFPAVFEHKTLSSMYDRRAAGGSEIRLMSGDGQFNHCTIPPGSTTKAVKLTTNEEIGYVLSGEGEIWQQAGEEESIHPLMPGVGIKLPQGFSYQFRNIGSSPLCILLFSRLPWQGKKKTMSVKGRWDLNKSA